MISSTRKIPGFYGMKECPFILETKKGFYPIGRWKAKMIRLLHLQPLFGVIYSTEIENLLPLLNEVDLLFKQSVDGKKNEQKEKYDILRSLAKTFVTLASNDSSFQEILKKVNEASLSSIMRHLRSDKESQESDWCDRYGVLLADKFIEEHGGESEEIVIADLCHELCKKVETEFFAQKKEILKSFFAQLKQSPFAVITESIAISYFTLWETTKFFEEVKLSFRAFRSTNTDAIPAEVAKWFKLFLQDISIKDPEKVRDMAHYLICLMQNEIPEEKMKESFRAYGVFIAEGCKGSIINAFEEAARSYRALFSAEAFKCFMEGLIERKGSVYFRTVVRGMRTNSELVTDMKAYEDKARGLFSQAAGGVVLGVVKELVRFQPKAQRADFCNRLSLIFEQIYETRKDFSVIAPFLGWKLMKAKPIAPEAVRESCRLTRETSQKRIWSCESQKIDVQSLFAEDFMTIERKIVERMRNIPSFCGYYGSLIGNKIIDQMSEQKEIDPSKISEMRGNYEKFVRDFFPEHSKEILSSMENVLTRIR